MLEADRKRRLRLHLWRGAYAARRLRCDAARRWRQPLCLSPAECSDLGADSRGPLSQRIGRAGTAAARALGPRLGRARFWSRGARAAALTAAPTALPPRSAKPHRGRRRGSESSHARFARRRPREGARLAQMRRRRPADGLRLCFAQRLSLCPACRPALLLRNAAPACPAPLGHLRPAPRQESQQTQAREQENKERQKRERERERERDERGGRERSLAQTIPLSAADTGGALSPPCLSPRGLA